MQWFDIGKIHRTYFGNDSNDTRKSVYMYIYIYIYKYIYVYMYMDALPSNKWEFLSQLGILIVLGHHLDIEWGPRYDMCENLWKTKELILKVFLNRDFYSGMVLFSCMFLYWNTISRVTFLELSNWPALSLTEVAELYCDTNPF